ncbi:MAG TPA: hypothetical protein VKF17_06310 [Isosphaeraceae bacterium]|nr:hypothetical protein [Isosphaeraceae bacterium]
MQAKPKEFLITFTIDKLAKTLQTLFTTEADTAGKESGMIQPRRKISGAGFVQSLVFGWLEDPKTQGVPRERRERFRGHHT